MRLTFDYQGEQFVFPIEKPDFTIDNVTLISNQSGLSDEVIEILMDTNDTFEDLERGISSTLEKKDELNVNDDELLSILNTVGTLGLPQTTEYIRVSDLEAHGLTQLNNGDIIAID